jgi:hypothetical protein
MNDTYLDEEDKAKQAGLARGLIELWDEYRASSTRVFQPTMTDFIEWLREHASSQVVGVRKS